MPPIERIRTPSSEQFWEQYALNQRPVILTDLLEGQPISQLSTLAKVRESLGGMKIEIRHNYSVETLIPVFSQRSIQNMPRQVRTLSEYLDRLEADPNNSEVCSEYETPARVHGLFEMPSLSKGAHARGGILSAIFVARHGNWAPIHLNQDHRQVLLYQVCGRKRVIMLPPRSAWKLNPIGHYSNVRLEHMPEPDKRKFVEFADGYDCVISPGEAVFIPALFWHYIEYVDTGMSFNIRFGRNQHAEKLAIETFPSADYRLQNLASLFIDETTFDDRHRTILSEIQTELDRPCESRIEKHRRMMAVCNSLYQRFVPDAVKDPTWIIPVHDLEDMLAEQVMKQTAHFVPGRPSMSPGANKPVIATQLRSIEGLVRRLGYDGDLLARIISNRFDKQTVDSLAFTEAAELLAYLNSPSSQA